MKEVKVGLIGFGFMGTTHWGIYRGLKNVRVVALADVDAAKRRGDVSKVVGNIGGGDNSKPIDLGGVAVYADAMKLIREADVDMIDICVPTSEHAKFAIAALRAGRHVFCEKPLCRTAAEAAKKAKGFFNVGLCVRAWPEYRAAWEYYKSGKAGNLHGFGDSILAGEVDYPAVFAALEACGYDRTFTVEMIPFSRLPDLVLPDQALAEKSVGELKRICG